MNPIIVLTAENITNPRGMMKCYERRGSNTECDYGRQWYQMAGLYVIDGTLNTLRQNESLLL